MNEFQKKTTLIENLYPKLIAKGATDKEARDLCDEAMKQTGDIIKVPFAGGWVVTNRQGVARQ